MSTHSRLVRALYRSLLRSAKSLDSKAEGSSLLAPLFFPGSAASLACPAFPSTTLASLVSPAFSPSHRSLPPGPGLERMLNRCLAALSTLNSLNAHPSPTRLNLMKGRPSGVAFLVGQVVRHVPTGHKGVVIGWAEECQGSGDFLTRNSILDPKTPFYTVLVDLTDRPSASVGLWAQGALELCPLSSQISHPLKEVLFEEGLGQRGLVPGPKLSLLFPLDKLLMSSHQGSWAGGADTTGGGAEGFPHQPESVKTLG